MKAVFMTEYHKGQLLKECFHECVGGNDIILDMGCYILPYICKGK